MRTRFAASTLVIAALCGLSAGVGAGQQATLEDGRKVLLKEDGRWEYLTPEAASDDEQHSAVLTVERLESIPQGCRLGLRLQNDLTTRIRSLVLRFTAYKAGPIAYETISRGFSLIKPTDSQYREIRFRDVPCNEIAQVQVHGADNCHIGELTKYTEGSDSCLSLVQVADSTLIKIYK
jgi:hypothetical protein